ncbi:MAG: hypothetical protein CMC19_06975 [Flavobacteriaceae bacterium]|nr:hypothetical protein [Flavobacteriaceae bacterium]OUX39649.1 MAG: hypothetical protein CBE25_03495 [Flavobacteriaceae bacterium TMED265]
MVISLGHMVLNFSLRLLVVYLFFYLFSWAFLTLVYRLNAKHNFQNVGFIFLISVFAKPILYGIVWGSSSALFSSESNYDVQNDLLPFLLSTTLEVIVLIQWLARSENT